MRCQPQRCSCRYDFTVEGDTETFTFNTGPAVGAVDGVAVGMTGLPVGLSVAVAAESSPATRTDAMHAVRDAII